MCRRSEGKGSDRLWTRCRASALPPVADWGLTLAGAVQGSRGTSSAMPLEHLAGTDPRCNDRYFDITVASEQLSEQRPVVLLQPCLRDSLELEEQLAPGHLALPQRTRSEWMWHGKNDKLVNAIRMT